MAGTSTETLLQELVDAQRRVVDSFFERLEFDQWESALKIYAESAGTLHFVGVGKSGYVAEKIAATLSSTGSRAYSLCAVNALHGDVSRVQPGDVVTLLSKSGESDELLALLPSLRQRGAKTIAVVCKAESRLAQQADHVVHLPLDRELCPFNLAPTSSPTIQMLFGDILAVALMRMKKFTKEEYGANHPSGRIGKRLLYKVHDLMLKGAQVPYCTPEQTLGQLLVELSSKRCGCLVVVDDNKNLLGIFTDGDLRRGLESLGATVLEKRVGDLMTKTPRTIQSVVAATEAMRLMEADPQRPVMMLPVVDDGVCVGLIKMHDIIQSGI